MHIVTYFSSSVLLLLVTITIVDAVLQITVDTGARNVYVLHFKIPGSNSRHARYATNTN